MKHILLVLTMFLFPMIVFAASATPAAEPVQYDLPYPGMLPNNPLYVLKQARDWILDKLITDPVKKTEFYILQADKRLAMGMMLVDSGNGNLAETTVSKGEKYLNNAVQLLTSVQTQGREIPAYLLEHLKLSLARHEEVVMQQISKTTDDGLKSGYTGSLHLIKTLQGDVEKLK